MPYVATRGAVPATCGPQPPGRRARYRLLPGACEAAIRRRDHAAGSESGCAGACRQACVALAPVSGPGRRAGTAPLDGEALRLRGAELRAALVTGASGAES